MVGIALIGLLALALRVYALDFGLPSWLHPDEFSFVFIPLNFFSGDFNPHFFTYPTFHYYALGLVYLIYFLYENLGGAGYSLEEFLALHYFWNQVELMSLARLLSALYGTGTVVWVGLLARRVSGAKATWAAGALLAVGVVHMRQSYLAGVDVAMTFYFVGAVWAAVRLLERERLGDYLLAGVLVGLAAACKYPGALAGVGVAVAHLVARRSFASRHLWLAGLTAASIFVSLSPYVILDFDSFATHFSAQVGQLDRGRGGDLGHGWWHHLRFSLVVNGGWLALLLLAMGAIDTVWRKHSAGLIVLATFFGYYAIMGSGQTVFTRYALPLIVLQAVLVGGVVAKVDRRGQRALVLALILAQPLYASWHQIRLLAQDDTRVEARAWIEEHIPTGAVLGNFGGWAGDVRLRTFEELWWSVSHFEQVFGRERTDRAVAFLAERDDAAPFYGYALQRTNGDKAAGSMEEVERLETAWIILHRHPLGYSRVDSAFVDELASRADQVASFSPRNLWLPTADYDVLDAFYLPLGGYGELDRPGPEIEIWRVHDNPIVSGRSWNVPQVFARAYVAGAASNLGQGDLAEAAATARRALVFDEESADAYYTLAMSRHIAGDMAEAELFYLRCLNLESPAGKAAVLFNLGVLYERLGEFEKAEQAYRGASEIAPWNHKFLRQMSDFFRRRGQAAQALLVCEERRHMFADRPKFLETIGRLYEEVGRLAEATAMYAEAVKRHRCEPDTYLRLANLYGQQRHYDLLIDTCFELLLHEPDHAEAHRLLAFVLKHQGRSSDALEHARAYVNLVPEGEDATQLANWIRNETVRP